MGKDRVLIIKSSEIKNANYYCGFEYIDDSCYQDVGDYRVYYDSSSRIVEILEQVEDSEES